MIINSEDFDVEAIRRSVISPALTYFERLRIDRLIGALLKELEDERQNSHSRTFLARIGELERERDALLKERERQCRCSFGGSYGRCELLSGHEGDHRVVPLSDAGGWL